nr:uncharacterized protein LOC105846597 [Hydra vulgaris]
MKIRTRNSSPVYKDYSESDDSEQSDCSKNSQQIKLKSLPNFPLLLKENQPTASLMTMKDKESLQSVNANEVKVSSTIMQPRHEARSLELTNFELSDISEQDDLNLKDSSVNDDDSLQSLLKKLHVITLKSYQSIKELTLRVCRIEDDLCKMKLSLVGNIAEDNQDQMFVMEQYKTSDTFQNFCKMLEEDSVFRKLVIKFMIINYGQKSIWPCVRSILRASLSDNLMTLFNCTGSRGQSEKVEAFDNIKKIPSVSKLLYPHSYEQSYVSSSVLSGSDLLPSKEEFHNVQGFGCFDIDDSIAWKSINAVEKAADLFTDNLSNNDESNDLTFKEDLAQWAVQCSVPLATLTSLLKVLHNHFSVDLPTQATTLLKTPCKTNFCLSGGDYTYFGIKDGILRTIFKKDLDFVELIFNIDGLSIHKSTNACLWPIQCRVDNVRENSPFVVALFCGVQKPTSLEFLEEFTL